LPRAAAAVVAEALTEADDRRDTGPETEHDPGAEIGSTAARKASHDIEFHPVKLIPPGGSENRERMMSDPSTPRARLPLLRLTLLVVVIVAGLVLLFTVGRRTPVVVVPAGSEVRP